MTKRRSPGSIRFLTSGAMQLEDGSALSPGPVLGGRAALQASRSHRVLLHSYPRTEDISDDPGRIAEALAGLRTDGELFSHRARVFSDGAVSVLVLDFLH